MMKKINIILFTGVIVTAFFVYGIISIDPTSLPNYLTTATAIAAAFAAYLMWASNEKMIKTMIQPRIFIYGSDIPRRMNIPQGPGGLAANQYSIPGLFVENIGKGPAVKGVLYVIDHQDNKIPIRKPNENYTFLRIPEGGRYHFPSYDSPELEQYIKGQNKIRIQVRYFDINNVPYDLPQTEEIVDLY